VRALVVHGGAGVASAAADAQQRACALALDAGWSILSAGGSALDAVVAAVEHMEDEPTLNAGYGGCLTEEGTVELDAAVMDGRERRAGAVALVRRLRHPVRAARLLLDEGRHVFLAGDAVEAFAAARGMALVDPTTLVTPARWATWTARQRASDATASAPTGGERDAGSGEDGVGTVGAVALDTAGHVAAATSTGGIGGKRAGRIGDSPIIGAGTLADDRAGAASATGDGEAIIRATVASVALDVLLSGASPERAAAVALAELTRVGGTGGVILVDRFGRVAAAHTTPHMTWASRCA
jgi:beta-aspartyl-peptidase (threonine type)